jgi:glycolate oxidase
VPSPFSSTAELFRENDPVKLSDRVLGLVSEAVGGAVTADAAGMERYGRDETPALFSPPGLVVRPSSAQEVSALLALASAEGFAVIPRGAGTGVVGGAIPFDEAVVLSLSKR